MKTEKDLHNYLKKQCDYHGVIFYKFSSPARRGVPDVILVHRLKYSESMPDRVCFVELKSPSGKGRLSDLQLLEIERLRWAGAKVHVLDLPSQVDSLMKLLTEEQ